MLWEKVHSKINQNYFKILKCMLIARIFRNTKYSKLKIKIVALNTIHYMISSVFSKCMKLGSIYICIYIYI